MADTATQPTVLFEEVQRTSSTAVLGILIAVGGVMAGAAGFAASRRALVAALPGLTIGVAVTAFVMLMITATRMYSRVTTTEAAFRYGPFGGVTLRPGEIASAEMVRFGMFSGGIGYHIGLKSTAITARTGDGVRILTRAGRRVLVGTQHPEALYSALLRLQAAAKPGV